LKAKVVKAVKKTVKRKQVETWIVANRKKYPNEIKELDYIIKTTAKDEFVLSMYNALVGGRYISDKMLNAIHGIMKRNSPMEMEKTRMWQERIVPKLNRLRDMIEYVEGGRIHTGYINSHPFVLSIIDQAKNRGTLSKKQMLAVNKMWIRYKEKNDKKVEKNKKSA
jgi:hypothetical protein